ncbi:MAG: response regulator [Nitrospirae bacterium]|nr:MAG: response regulator [Nitrospirota bacterium]
MGPPTNEAESIGRDHAKRAGKQEWDRHFTGLCHCLYTDSYTMKRVIIAEDIYAALREEQSFLDRSDIGVAPAGSNSEVLALHREKPADLVIAKLDDDKLSGENLCSLIRSDSKLQKVSIIIVCSGGKADVKRCVACNANVFVPGPLNAAILLQEAYHLLHIAPRRSCRIEVKITLEGTIKGRPFVGHTENISSAGMLLRSPADLLEGDIVVCSFSLPGSKRLTVTAEVVRVLQKKRKEENLFGLSFTEISPAAGSAIEALTAE